MTLINVPILFLFHEIQRLVILTACKMEDAFADREPGKSHDYDIRKVLQRWRHDIDETMVHVFDFVYFYGKDVDHNVHGIWASWGVIPNVGTRVLEYVVRTISAVLISHLRSGDQGLDDAKEKVQRTLNDLQTSGLGGRYVSQALPNNWYYYDLSLGWLPGFSFTYQGALIDLPPYEVLNMKGRSGTRLIGYEISC